MHTSPFGLGTATMGAAPGADPGKNFKEGLYHAATGEGIQCSGEQRREALIQSTRSAGKSFHRHFPIV